MPTQRQSDSKIESAVVLFVCLLLSSFIVLGILVAEAVSGVIF